MATVRTDTPGASTSTAAETSSEAEGTSSPASDDVDHSIEDLDSYMTGLGLDPSDYSPCRVSGALSGDLTSNIDTAAVVSSTIVIEGGVPLYTYLFLADGYTFTILHNAGLPTVYGTIVETGTQLDSTDTFTPEPTDGTDDLDQSGGHLNAKWYGSGALTGQTAESSLDIEC